MGPKRNLAICTLAIIIFLAGVLTTVSAQSPNFGYSQVGSSLNSTFGGLYVSNFTGPSNLGNITQIYVYMSTGGTLAQAVIYLDDNGKPGALLNASNPVNVEGTSGAWVGFDISYKGIPQFKYWIGVLLKNAGTYYSTQGENENALYFAQVSEATNPFPLGSMSAYESMSVYALYTPSTPINQSGNWIQTLLFSVMFVGAVLALIATVLLLVKKSRRIRIDAQIQHILNPEYSNNCY